jgi:hypothetical protein
MCARSTGPAVVVGTAAPSDQQQGEDAGHQTGRGERLNVDPPSAGVVTAGPSQGVRIDGS